MDIVSRIREQLSDGRFSANLIAFYGLAVVAVILSLVLRRWLTRSSHRWAHRTRIPWLDTLGEEILRRASTLLFWGTLVAVVATTIIGLGYHATGGDIRQDVSAWLATLTPGEAVRIGIGLGGLLALLVAGRIGIWMVRRLRPILESRVQHWIHRPGHENIVRRWFGLLELYLVASVRLWALWGAGQVVGLSNFADWTVGFVLRVLTILVGARLLTLACRVLTQILAEIGSQHLGQGHLRRYWERILHLFPFGERCFEAAVYVTATSLCVRELNFIQVVADFGPRIVQCIGILFGTRVLIELLQVLLNEAFGLYEEGGSLDQKGRTLVPLLHSVLQYVLYFGSGVIMLGVLGIDIRPILAAAGILGLAVGLGAQNLVTDVVSGFFILFENQFLVGDFVQVGDACGTVESVSIRLTQIRDAYGKLYIIPNGQIKGVVSYSKGYVNAVVDHRAPSGSDLEVIFRAMHEAGRLLREQNPEVLSETQILGLIELGTSEMTIRAVTKVEPGAHGQMQNEYRRLLKSVFDQPGPAGRTKAA
ncbi:MAG: mechanosensitive ion channel family protein [Planctomycetes bacterium]|nr:mechanosensitive ion channel family protein [Planctomycetota bacterium]